MNYGNFTYGNIYDGLLNISVSDEVIHIDLSVRLIFAIVVILCVAWVVYTTYKGKPKDLE
jgi:hypothetical protein